VKIVTLFIALFFASAPVFAGEDEIFRAAGSIVAPPYKSGEFILAVQEYADTKCQTLQGPRRWSCEKDAMALAQEGATIKVVMVNADILSTYNKAEARKVRSEGLGRYFELLWKLEKFLSRFL
jgi:hypothetical protein